jgi:hypothetical protein
VGDDKSQSSLALEDQRLNWRRVRNSTDTMALDIDLIVTNATIVNSLPPPPPPFPHLSPPYPD